MKRSLLLCCLFAVLGIYGCQFFSKSGSSGEGSPVSSLGVEPIRRSGNASLVFTFRIPRAPAASPDVLAATVSGIRVAFILKLINPGHPEEPYTQVRQEVDVVNGVASATFVNLPPNSVVGEVLISSGTYRGYSDFHGAVDLVDTASNSLEIAPMGSSEDPAQVAQVIKNMLGDTSYFGYIQPKIAAAMKAALVEGRTRVGTDSTQLLANVREAYLAQTSTKPTTLNQALGAAQEFMTGYETYKDRAYADQSVAASPGPSIRAAIRSWSWDPDLRIWFNIVPGATPEETRTYAYAYMTAKRDRRYQYISDSPEIDRLETFSEWNVRTADGLVKITDDNQYIFGAGMQTGSPWFDHTGQTRAKIGDTEIWNIWSDLRNCNIGSKYPGFGWIGHWDDKTSVRTKFIFNGTCVAKVEVSQSGTITGTYFSFLDFLGAEPVPQGDHLVGAPPACAPRNVRAVATHSNFILSWDPVPDATGYDVYWSDRSFTSLIDAGRLPLVTNPCMNTGEVSMFSPIFLRVVARSAGFESEPSEEVSVTPLGPPQPNGLAAQTYDNQVVLSWNRVNYARTNDPTYYRYLVLTATKTIDVSAFDKAVLSSSGAYETSNNQYRISGLTLGQTYHFCVLTVGKARTGSIYPYFGISTPSAEITVTPTANGMVLPPYNVSGTPGNLLFSAAWSPNPDAFAYLVFTDTGAGFDYNNPFYYLYRDFQYDSSNRLIWTYPSLLPKGTMVSLKVASVISVNGQYVGSDYSSPTVTGKVLGPYPITDTLAAPGNAANTITWSYSSVWQSVTEKYNLYWSAGPITSTASANLIASVTSPYVHTGLTNGTRYYYAVTSVAKQGYGESDASTVVSAIPRSTVIPAVPAGFAATASTSATVLSWTEVDLATSYNIYWSTSPGVSKSTGTKISGITQSPYRHGNLTPGTTYFYVISAVGAEGESAASAIVSAVPQGAPVMGTLRGPGAD